MKLLRIVLLLGALFGAAEAMAEKVAVLDVDRALAVSKAAELFRQQLRAELAANEAEVVALEKQARAAGEKVKQNQGLLSADELRKLQLQAQKAFQQYQQAGQALQQERLQKEQAFLQEMKPKLDEVIRGLIKQDGYDVIIAKQATLYAKKDLDITARVVELLNAQ